MLADEAVRCTALPPAFLVPLEDAAARGDVPILLSLLTARGVAIGVVVPATKLAWRGEICDRASTLGRLRLDSLPSDEAPRAANEDDGAIAALSVGPGE